MFLSKAICAVCVASIATAPMVGPLDPMRGDLNGDARIDVLDLQSLTAALLEGGGRTEADLNGDGRVDVLDYQRALAQRVEEEPGGLPEIPNRPDSKGIMPPPLRLDGAQPSFDRIVARLAPVQTSLPLLSGRREANTAACPQIQRYLFNLTPHAPPFAA